MTPPTLATSHQHGHLLKARSKHPLHHWYDAAWRTWTSLTSRSLGTHPTFSIFFNKSVQFNDFFYCLGGGLLRTWRFQLHPSFLEISFGGYVAMACQGQMLPSCGWRNACAAIVASTRLSWRAVLKSFFCEMHLDCKALNHAYGEPRLNTQIVPGD